MKVVQLYEVPVNDIAGMARQFADAYEAGEYAGTTTALLVLDGTQAMHTLNWGDGPSCNEAIGILETAKQHIIRNLLGD